jgi:hypothetical protein
MDKDIVEKLEGLAAVKVGDTLPDWLADDPDWQINSWVRGLSKLLNEAKNEIIRLRRIAGAVSEGQSFSDIRDRATHG